jgi:hypothetical protein
MCEIEDVFQRSNADISRELTPEQRPLLAEMDRERREFFQHRHPERSLSHSFNHDQSVSVEKTNTANYGGK